MRKVSAPAFELADALAIKAVAEGRADEHQQRRAVKWLLRGLCEVGRLAYSPDSERDTAFALGRQSVGFEVQLYIQEHADILREIAERRKSRGA
jgi:hypothetical protein